jgi:hypothetical protein
MGPIGDISRQQKTSSLIGLPPGGKLSEDKSTFAALMEQGVGSYTLHIRFTIGGFRGIGIKSAPSCRGDGKSTLQQHTRVDAIGGTVLLSRLQLNDPKAR